MPRFRKSYTSVQDFVILFRASFTAVLIALLAALGFSASTGCSGGPGGAGQASLAQSQRSTIYYLDDHLGSAQVVADAATGAIYEQELYPYGLNDDSSASTLTLESDYSYTTKERDDKTGLIYFGRRYYSPAIGRWITPDPLFLEDTELVTKMPREFNLYAYVQNNPVSNLDVDGLITIGYDVDYTAGAGGAYRRGYTFVGDDKGNIGMVLHSGGGGYGGVGAGAEGNIQVTNAESIFQLAGGSLSVGATGGNLITGNIEMLIGEGNGVKGVEVGFGIAIPMPACVELHSIYEDNEVIFSFNPVEFMKELFDDALEEVKHELTE